jgi:hypothetical protein
MMFYVILFYTILIDFIKNLITNVYLYSNIPIGEHFILNEFICVLYDSTFYCHNNSYWEYVTLKTFANVCMIHH